MDNGDHPYNSWATLTQGWSPSSIYYKVPPNQRSTTVGGPIKWLEAADKWMIVDCGPGVHSPQST